MSSVNIRRVVENIRSGTNIYTPLVELVVNAIQAIDNKKSDKGLVDIQIIRDSQEDMVDRLRAVDGFIVSDNGIGFNQRNRDSFDTLFTDEKLADGGKGFGRFTCLKYYECVEVRSVFADGDTFQERTFRMGTDKNIIVDEQVTLSSKTETGSKIEISSVRSVKFPDKGIDVISRVLVERLLPYFVDAEKPCPRVIIRDANGSTTPVSLNDYLGKEDSQIVEMPIKDGSFTLISNSEEKTFSVRVFKFYSPRTTQSKVTLVAHRREVTDVALKNYVPEFAEEFCEPDTAPEAVKGRNFVIKAYVFGDYLNDNVSLERGEFRFQTDTDLLNGISQTQIEEKAAEIAQAAIGAEIEERKRRKHARIEQYVTNEAPWHRRLSAEVDFSSLPMRPSANDIELHLQRKKFEKETDTRIKVAAIMRDDEQTDLEQKIAEVVSSISETSRNDLIHYVSMRKCVLDLFSKALDADDDGKHKSEGEVHDIIMQRRKDSDELDFESHNLWILDERLNFSEFISSDKPINVGRSDRTDITIYGKRVAFRGENAASNPITIFEFKKPQRTDFANPASSEDPVAQVISYVNQIREGKYKTPRHRDILVNDNTPFYGYIVCDIPKKVAEWLEKQKDFKPMPDGLGWFYWHNNLNLYIEVISWTKLLRDAEMRNRIFFKALGID